MRSVTDRTLSTDGVALRPLTTADREDVVELRAAASALATAYELELLVPASLEGYECAVGAFAGTTLVGCATAHAPAFLGPGARLVLVVVDPAWRRRGIGSALHEAVLASAPADVVLWATTDDADGPAAAAFAQAHGYRQELHHLTQELDLTDAATCAAVRSAPPPPAHVRVSVHPMQRTDPAAPVSDPALTAALTELMLEADTSPEAQHVPDRSWPMLLRNSDHLGRDGLVVLGYDAQGPDPARPVALASARPHDDVDDHLVPWHVMMTATRPTARRRGFATALKHRLHAEILTRGGRSLSTTNEAANTSVRAMNESLGYRLVGSQRQWARRPATPSRS
jgi:GNAT superfamily N-acetyltransferase